jgi:hypothetical protein
MPDLLTGRELPVPDTPENRQLWLSDFRNEREFQEILGKLLDAGFVQMTVKSNERAFRITTLGQTEIIGSLRFLQN